ncbi:uncharacterized protein LOC131157530 [Malania oleifera]|uniref:uncharacterized protein LOC131157530 n=1 Tax=Malania oleifera TaxID=397392 RepID=UPI0025AEC06E|nr:uncharacterized protein LOC131157530 [Malania oleifera]
MAASNSKSKTGATDSSPDEDVKATNLFERAKEEIEAIINTERSHKHREETHGRRGDIDVNTPMDYVKAPNVFERAKEEIEAVIQAIHPHKESQSSASPLGKRGHFTGSGRETTTKTELEPLKANSPFVTKGSSKTEKSHHHHHMETHGLSDDIDENMPVDDVRGPNVFERVKEEIEAIVETIHPKKRSSKTVSSPPKD